MVGEWEDSALCAQVQPDMFITDDHNMWRRAVRVCHGCPVKAACRVASVMEPFGVWGGTTAETRERQRRDAGIRKTDQVGAFRRAARHGQFTGDFIGALSEVVGRASAARWMAGYV